MVSMDRALPTWCRPAGLVSREDAGDWAVDPQPLSVLDLNPDCRSTTFLTLKTAAEGPAALPVLPEESRQSHVGR
ncbi:hypothetical protein V3F56_09270 [Moorellaceae bacterium AZ2]